MKIKIEPTEMDAYGDQREKQNSTAVEMKQ